MSGFRFLLFFALFFGALLFYSIFAIFVFDT